MKTESQNKENERTNKVTEQEPNEKAIFID